MYQYYKVNMFIFQNYSFQLLLQKEIKRHKNKARKEIWQDNSCRNYQNLNTLPNLSKLRLFNGTVLTL